MWAYNVETSKHEQKLLFPYIVDVLRFPHTAFLRDETKILTTRLSHKLQEPNFARASIH